MTAEEERGRRPLDRRAAPVAVLDLSRRSLWIPAGASALIAALALAGGLADDGSDDPARWVRWAEAGVVGGLPYWWTTVVYVLVAMGCWARARVEVARARYRGAGWVGPAPIGWGALSVLLVLLSADHVIGLHKAVTTDRVPWLPGPVADHPVQAVLVAVGLPVVLMVLAVATPGQRALVVLAGVLYLFSGLVLDPRLLQLPGVTYRTEALETAAEWVAAVVLLLAALQRVRMRGSARPGPPGVRTGAGLLEAVAVVDRLRSPGGDAWWAQQTSASLAR